MLSIDPAGSHGKLIWTFPFVGAFIVEFVLTRFSSLFVLTGRKRVTHIRSDSLFDNEHGMLFQIPINKQLISQVYQRTPVGGSNFVTVDT